MPSTQWNGQSIFYLEAVPQSYQSTVICVHGAGGNSRHWAHQLNLSKHLNSRIVAVDLPGHGRSSGPPLKTIKDYSLFIKDLIELWEIEHLSLIGHSMGSAICLALAANAPFMVENLILIGTAKQFKVAPWLLESLQKGERPLSFAEFAYHKNTAEQVLAAAKEEFQKTPISVLLNDFLACQAFNLEHPESGLNVPCLLLFGEQDRLTPVKYVEPLAAMLPNHRLSIIPEAGHMVMIEQPAATNEEIYRFLAQHS